MKEKRCVVGKVRLLLVCWMCSMFIAGIHSDIVLADSKKAITLKSTSDTIMLGKKATIKVKKVTGLKSKKVTFKSNNKKVATVSAKGVVKALKTGAATITVTSKEDKTVKANFKVKVVNDFFKANNANIKKVGTTYIQKGLYDSIGGGLYEAKTTVKYAGIETCSWNDNFDIVKVKVTTRLPYLDIGIGWRAALYDTTGRQAYSPGMDCELEQIDKMQMVPVFEWGKTYEAVGDIDAIITYSLLIPKNEGVYLEHGGYSSVKDYKDGEESGTINKGTQGGGKLKKSDLKDVYTFFYISSKDARKALK